MSAAPSPIDRTWGLFVRALEWFTILLFIALTLDVLWGVFSRYVLGAQATWTDELARYLLVWVSLFGAAIMYREHGHLGIDYFVGKLHPDVQRINAILGEVVVGGFALVVLVVGGGRLVRDAFNASEMTSALGIEVWWLHLATPVSGFFFVAFAIEHVLQRRLNLPATDPTGGAVK